MTVLQRRLDKLAKQWQPENSLPLVRYIFSSFDSRPDLQTAVCNRFIDEHSGRLFEVVRMRGDPDHLASGELDQFIASFPIRR